MKAGAPLPAAGKLAAPGPGRPAHPATRPRRRQRLLQAAAVAAAAGCLIACWLALTGGTGWPAAPNRQPPTLARFQTQPQLLGARPATAALPFQPAAQQNRSSADFSRWLRTQSSLRGVELDGDWGLDAQGRLRPSLALRRRFDMLLLLTGEASADELDRFIADSVTAAGGLDAAAAVLASWRRYVSLQQHAFVQQAAPDSPQTWAPALAEHQQVRRELLGIVMADAFYRDEEAAMYAHIDAAARRAAAGAAIGNDGPASGAQRAEDGGVVDRATLTVDARHRLDDERAAQARWSASVEEAQAQVAALRAAPQLSPLQRDQAIERWLVEHFDASEQRRVRGLLEGAAP